MKKDLAIKQLKSSFLSVEKDVGTIINKLFIESRPYSDDLKRLLIINTKDCLDNKTNPIYTQKLKEIGLKELMEKGYIRLTPKLNFGEFEEVKSYILISFDNFIPNAKNPQFRDCTVSFDIVCHTDHWDLGNYQLRPLKIVGFIDGILDNSRLTGIGTFQMMGCSQLILNEELSGYTLMYKAIHGSDDELPESDKIV